MSKPQALIEQVRSSVAVELERRHAPTLLADRKAAKAAKHKAKHHKYTKAAFFRYCYYDPAFKFFCEQVLDVDYLPLPEATRAASEVGVQNSSDYVCTPFKHILGDFAEALDLGADILIQFGGPCRLGYYGELQESILRDMGYDVHHAELRPRHRAGVHRLGQGSAEDGEPRTSTCPTACVKLKAVAKMIAHLDSLRDFYLANAGFEVERGALRRRLGLGDGRHAHLPGRARHQRGVPRGHGAPSAPFPWTSPPIPSASASSARCSRPSTSAATWGSTTSSSPWAWKCTAC